ncbi:hypothetical protein JCM1393_01420 [Clostridium carnis]
MNPILILLIGITLIILNVRAIKKEDKSFIAMLQKEEKNSNRDYDIEIISIRKDLAETVLDLQKEIEELKTSISSIKNIKLEDDNIKNNENKTALPSIENGVVSEINFNIKEDKKNKVNIVKDLLDEGLTEDEICDKLSIGKGEVLLIKGLLKN